MYRFTHIDNRSGVGWSCWAAIVKAIGPIESQSLPELKDPEWVYDDCMHDIIKRAEVLANDGAKIGCIDAIRD